MDCICSHLKILFCSCARGPQWCAIFHYQERTALIKSTEADIFDIQTILPEDLPFFSDSYILAYIHVYVSSLAFVKPKKLNETLLAPQINHNNDMALSFSLKYKYLFGYFLFQHVCVLKKPIHLYAKIQEYMFTNLILFA